MAKRKADKPAARTTSPPPDTAQSAAAGQRRRTSALLDTRVIYCGDCLDQLHKLPDDCVDLIYTDPPESSNRNAQPIRRPIRARAAASGLREPFDHGDASTAAHIDYMRPRCVELAPVLRKTGSLYYHCDWHASNLRPTLRNRARWESRT